jgi:hypothetical protein
MSPVNLENDSLFHDQLRNTACLPIELIMRCPRILEWKTTEDAIKKAVGSSKILKLNENNNGVVYQDAGFLLRLIDSRDKDISLLPLQNEYSKKQELHKIREQPRPRRKLEVLFRKQWQDKKAVSRCVANIRQTIGLGGYIDQGSREYEVVI